jgi:regulator of protease activity HflC (stomatin/prohibitin superfamily)
VITRDNVSVKVNAVLYFRVIDPSKALVEIAKYLFATPRLAQTTLRSVCGQAELDDLLAERERRAKVINAEGEFQAAQRLAEAAQIIGQHPTALQLRYLQTLSSVATENPSTTLFRVPIDPISPFLAAKKT